MVDHIKRAPQSKYKHSLYQKTVINDIQIYGGTEMLTTCAQKYTKMCTKTHKNVHKKYTIFVYINVHNCVDKCPQFLCRQVSTILWNNKAHFCGFMHNTHFVEWTKCTQFWGWVLRRHRCGQKCGHFVHNFYLEVFKMYKGLSLLHFSEFFKISYVVVIRGHSAKIEKQRCQLDLRRHFLSERAVNRWNSLPQHVIDAGSIYYLYGFKSAIEKLCCTQMGQFMD